MVDLKDVTMNFEFLDGMTQPEITRWLENALRGRETIPLLVPDEHLNIAVLRVHKQLDTKTIGLFRRAHAVLLERFCTDPDDDIEYVLELMFLTSEFIDVDNTCLIERLVENEAFDRLPKTVRTAVVGTLVDSKHQNSAEFWWNLFRRDNEYVMQAFNGLLTIDTEDAIAFLKEFPDNAELGEVAVLLFDLFFDEITAERKTSVINLIDGVLPNCGKNFTEPIYKWLTTVR